MIEKKSTKFHQPSAATIIQKVKHISFFFFFSTLHSRLATKVTKPCQQPTQRRQPPPATILVKPNEPPPPQNPQPITTNGKSHNQNHKF
jgi:hypothetical protein